MSFPRAGTGPRCSLVTQSCPSLCSPMDCVACQSPLSMRFSRQEYWSGLPFPTPGTFQTQGSNPRLLRWQADSLPLRPQGGLLGLTVIRFKFSSGTYYLSGFGLDWEFRSEQATFLHSWLYNLLGWTDHRKVQWLIFLSLWRKNSGPYKACLSLSLNH